MNEAAPAVLPPLVTDASRRKFTALPRAIWRALLEPRGAILAAFTLSLPALRTGLVADDFWHRAMLVPDAPGARALPLTGGPLTLFTFATGDAADHAQAVESGLMPWWSPILRMSFFRPISSLTHALDYALWPSSPALMHLHSILWYLAVVALAGALYRRWIGRISPHAAALAMLFYAIDPTHGFPVAWLANRNALIATVFAFCTLLLHDSGVQRAVEKKPRAALFPYAAGFTLALALGSGESAVATLFYLAAHAVFLDERPLAARVRSLVPAGVVTLAWATVYRLGHFGVKGSGMYHDPLGAPLDYLRGVATNGPLLLASELGLSPDAWAALPHGSKALLYAGALLLVGWMAFVARRAIFADDKEVRRVSRFLLAAGVISVLPSTAAMPSARLLVLPGFGLVGFLALFCARAVPEPRFFTKWVWLVHLVIAPVGFMVLLHAGDVIRSVVRPLEAGVPIEGASDKRLVLVNAPDTLITAFMATDLADRGGAPPERMLVMSGNRRDLRVTRTGEHTLTIHENGGFMRTGTELLFCDPSRPMAVGTKVALSDMDITVTHATPDGVPDEASFELTKDFEAYVFRKWEGSTLVPFELPAIGESVNFEGRMPKI